MKRAVLADTGPLYAAADSSDQYHARSQEELARLEREGLTIVVAHSTLLETYTLVLRRLGIGAAHHWLREVLAGSVLVNPTPEDYAEASRRAQSYADQPITLFDTVLAVLGERLTLPIWTYDHHFDLMKIAVWR